MANPRDSEHLQRQFDVRDRLIKSKVVSSIEYHSAVENYPSSSVSLAALRKLRVMTLFIWFRILPRGKRKKRLIPIKMLSGKFKGKKALVIGNGKSAEQLNVKKARTLQQAGDLVVFATNHFLRSEMAKQLRPDFLVWTDTNLLPETAESEEVSGLASLQYLGKTTLCVPWRWGDFESIQSVKSRLYFEDDATPGFGRNIDPTKIRSYGSNVAPKALAIALYMGFDEINVIGIDQDYFRDYSSDYENRLWKSSTVMSQGTSTHERWEIGPFRDGITTRLSRDLWAIRYLELYFVDSRIVNLHSESLLSVWSKASSKHYLK